MHVLRFKTGIAEQNGVLRERTQQYRTCTLDTVITVYVQKIPYATVWDLTPPRTAGVVSLG